MKLKPTSFYAAYPDGLVFLPGHAFSVKGRSLVVHKARPENLAFDQNYKISEATVGFSIQINPTRNRLTAVQFAIESMNRTSEEVWQDAIRNAAAIHKTLKVIEG